MFKLLWQSFGNAQAYANAIKNWRWKFAVYFFALSIGCALLVALVEIPEIKNQIDAQKDFILEQMPNGKIENSKFTMSQKSPYFVKSKTGTNIIGFTDGFLEPEQTRTLIAAFEKDRLSFYWGEDETYFFYEKFVSDYNKLNGLDSAANAPLLVNKASANDLIESVKASAFAVFAPFIVVFTIIANAILVMSISLPAFLLSITYAPNLRFLGAIKFSIIASTPAILLQTVQTLAGLSAINSVFFVFVSYYIVWRVMRKFPQI